MPIVILESTNRVVSIEGSILLYRLLQFIGSPFIFLYFAVRCVTNQPYRLFFSERLGRLPAPFQRTVPNSIWLHAVSVGEIVSAVPLIRRLRTDYPDVPIYL